MFQTSVTPLVKFTFALWGDLMGTPTAAGFHSPLSGALTESQGLREGGKAGVWWEYMFPTHLLISTDLGSIDMVGFKDRPLSKVYLFPFSHYISWKLDTFYGLIDLNLINGALMGKLYIVYCWSKIARALLVSIVEVVTLEAKSTGHILIHLSRTITAGKCSNQ